MTCVKPVGLSRNIESRARLAKLQVRCIYTEVHMNYREEKPEQGKVPLGPAPSSK